MSRPTFHWFLPMRDDTRRYGGDPAPRRADRGYLGEVARAAERGGFESMLVATAHDTADTWLMAAAAAQATSRIRFIVAFRAGYSLPTLVAQQVETFAQLHDDRIDVNVVTGSDVPEQAAYGDTLDKALRYERTAEFIDILRRELSGERYDFDGRHYRVGAGRSSTSAGSPRSPPTSVAGSRTCSSCTARPPRWCATTSNAWASGRRRTAAASSSASGSR